jgi:hypothetical protein
MTDDPVSMTPKEEEEFFWNHLPRKERKAIMERRKATMNQYQLEQFLLLYGSRNERKAIKERRKAEQEALKKQSK